MTAEVRRADERGQYELYVDGELVGVADYRPGPGGAVVLPHTEIAPDRRGQGLGAVLVRGVLDDLRAAGRTVVPECWYVARFIAEHPDDGDLVAG